MIVASTEETMRRVLAWLEHKYGRVEDYLASTGGGADASTPSGSHWCSPRLQG